MNPTETKPPEKLRGEKLAKTVINQILACPETWDQSTWHSSCGTKHCFAGWCQILSGKDADRNTVQGDAIDALGISREEGDFLFRGSATLSELYYFAAHFSDAGFDRAGFDRDGFDRAGFGRDGFDRAGFGRDGKKLEPFVI